MWFVKIEKFVFCVLQIFRQLNLWESCVKLYKIWTKIRQSSRLGQEDR